MRPSHAKPSFLVRDDFLQNRSSSLFVTPLTFWLRFPAAISSFLRPLSRFTSLPDALHPGIPKSHNCTPSKLNHFLSLPPITTGTIWGRRGGDPSRGPEISKLPPYEIRSLSLYAAYYNGTNLEPSWGGPQLGPPDPTAAPSPSSVPFHFRHADGIELVFFFNRARPRLQMQS